MEGKGREQFRLPMQLSVAKPSWNWHLMLPCFAEQRLEPQMPFDVHAWGNNKRTLLRNAMACDVIEELEIAAGGRVLSSTANGPLQIRK